MVTGNPLYVSVRGRGLLDAVELKHPCAHAVMNYCLEHGLIVNAVAPNALRFAPPLIVTAEDVDQALAVLRTCPLICRTTDLPDLYKEITMTPELRHMLRDDDLNHEEQKQVLELAIKFSKNRFYKQPFAGPQAVAVLFDKPSTRTRSSFSIGVAELGGYPLVIDKSGSQLGRGEPVADTARVLDRMAYGVVWRTFGQDRVEEMAKYSTHPVVNALTDDFHPCQILADFQTIAEHRGGVDNLKNQTIAYLGDAANNMSNSYLLGGAVAGMNVRVAGPQGYLPRPDIVADAERIAAENGGSILVTTDAREAVAGADCVFTDTWVSMGEEAEYAIRSKPFWDYQVNAELMALAKPDALFQHCLPAYRGKEVTAEVIDGPQSVVWDEAENRLHAQKALLTWLTGKARGDESLLA